MVILEAGEVVEERWQLPPSPAPLLQSASSQNRRCCGFLHLQGLRVAGCSAHSLSPCSLSQHFPLASSSVWSQGPWTLTAPFPFSHGCVVFRGPRSRPVRSFCASFVDGPDFLSHPNSSFTPRHRGFLPRTQQCPQGKLGRDVTSLGMAFPFLEFRSI